MNNANKEKAVFNGFFKVLPEKFAGIKTKLILVFILLSVTPFIIWGSISYITSRSVMTGCLPSVIRKGLNGMGNSLELLMANTENKMTAISSNTDFRQQLLQLTASSLQNGGARELLQKLEFFLQAQIGKDNYIARVMILRGANNSLNCSFTSREKYQIVVDSAWYRKVLALNGNFLWISSHPELNTPNDYSLSCLQLIPHNGDNSKHDILIIDISNTVISNILSRPFIENGGRTYLIDPAQQIAAAASVNKSSKTKQKNVAFGKNFIDSPEFKRLQQGKTRCRAMNFPGKNSIKIGYWKLSQNGWILFYLIFKAEYAAALTPFSWPLIGGIGILLLTIAAISGGFFFAKRFTGSLPEILTALKSVETGDLTQKVAVNGKDEIGILAEAYNLMVDSINQLITTIRNTIEKQKNAAQTIAATSGEISDSISNIINTVHEITQSITEQSKETSNSNNCMNELAAKINQVISNVNTIQQIAEGTKNMSVDGIKAIEDLSRDVSETTTVTLSISEHLNTLNEETNQVTETISAINEIADRNNLLAMNAIIGAAKAGEAGKGFSVVANNVKKLAEKSMNSTKEISNFITDLQRRMAATVETSLNIDKTVVAQNQAFKASIQVFNQINTLANNLTKKLAEIVKLVNNMETSKTETLSSMENITLKSQQTAGIMNEIYNTIQDQFNTVENLTNMSRELLKVTDELDGVIKKFKTGSNDDTGNKQSPASSIADFEFEQ